MPPSEYRVIVTRRKIVQVESIKPPFAGLEFGARHGFVVRRAYAVPRQPVWVVIVLCPEHTLLVADGEVVPVGAGYSDKLVGVVGEVGIENAVSGD